MPPLPITKVSISGQTTITPPTPTVYRYYHQGVFYIIGKQLFWHQTCEFDIDNLHLQARNRMSTSTWLTTKSVTTQKVNQGKENRQLKSLTNLSRT
jgi:hypothetical protein